jgi:ketosteroid isomerase-like protein
MTNLQIVQDAYGKFGSGDVSGLIALLSADVDWRVPEIESSAFGGAWNGQEGVGKFFAALVADEEITEFEPREFISEGEKVVVLGRSTATVRATGKTYETDWVHVFTVRDGKITKFHEFFDNNAAATRAYQKTASA